MTREQLISRITEEVVRALAEREGATGTAAAGVRSGGGAAVPADPRLGTPGAGAKAAAGGPRRFPADGLADLCRDLGVCRIGSAPGEATAPGLASMIDHTVLKPDATRADIEKLCAEARAARFASVCVQPWWVGLCADLLEGSVVKVCTVVGFPHGMNRPETKAFEARRAVLDGATEVDMVVNIGALKSKDFGTVERDIRGVVESSKPRATVKVILENVYLTNEEKAEACALAKAAGADYVKTSTGFAGGGATVEDVELMRRVVGPEMGVKAAGGIRDTESARRMIAAGATRLGASASLAIVQGESSGSATAGPSA